MGQAPLLILAQQAERLAVVLKDRLPEETFLVGNELSQVPTLLAQHHPEAVLIYKDIGFEGPELRAAAMAPSMRWVHVSGSGYEYLLPLERSDLAITNGQGLRSRHLAETLLGAMIALNNGLLTYRTLQKARDWQPREFRPLEGQKLLVVGTGMIGTWVGRYAKAMGMSVMGLNRRGTPLAPFDEVVPLSQLSEVLPQGDVISLHLRQTEETVGCIGAVQFERMKASALFINTARGGLVDQAALVEALRTDRLRGAYLDVFEQEPLPPDSPLWGMENVLISPHAADMIEDWDIKGALFFAENVARWRANQPLLNLVDL